MINKNPPITPTIIGAAIPHQGATEMTANVLDELDEILSDANRDVEVRAFTEKLESIRTRIAALVEAAKLARRRFSDQNGKVSAEVWSENYDAVHALDEALRGVGQ